MPQYVSERIAEVRISSQAHRWIASRCLPSELFDTLPTSADLPAVSRVFCAMV
jgi:hypothetical protein